MPGNTEAALSSTLIADYQFLVDDFLSDKESVLKAESGVKSVPVTPQLVGELIGGIFDNIASSSVLDAIAQRTLDASSDTEAIQPLIDALKRNEKPQEMQIAGGFAGMQVKELMALLTGMRSGAFDEVTLEKIATGMKEVDAIAPSANMGPEMQRSRVIRAWTKNILLSPIQQT